MHVNRQRKLPLRELAGGAGPSVTQLRQLAGTRATDGYSCLVDYCTDFQTVALRTGSWRGGGGATGSHLVMHSQAADATRTNGKAEPWE